MLTFCATVIELVSKFTEGAWLVCLAIPLMVLMFERIHGSYTRIGEILGLGEVPGPAVEQQALVVVPVGAVSRLTQEAISAAKSLGDGVVAVTVRYGDEEDVAACADLQARWSAWQLDVPLVVLTSRQRNLSRPIVDYVNRLAVEAPASPEAYERIMVLIPEVQPQKLWHWLLHNQRGAILDRAVRKNTEAVVCRMRFRLSGW